MRGDKPGAPATPVAVGSLYFVLGFRFLHAPGVDAAGHALAGGHALFPQPVHHVQAAHSVVTEDDQCGFAGLRLELLQARRDVPHGDQRGAFNPRDRALLWLANVDQQ